MALTRVSEDFMVKYFKQREDGTFELPPLMELEPDIVQAIGKHFSQIELEERLNFEKSDQLRFIG